jgi:hypothetical protein
MSAGGVSHSNNSSRCKVRVQPFLLEAKLFSGLQHLASA